MPSEYVKSSISSAEELSSFLTENGYTRFGIMKDSVLIDYDLKHHSLRGDLLSLFGFNSRTQSSATFDLVLEGFQCASGYYGKYEFIVYKNHKRMIPDEKGRLFQERVFFGK